MKTQHFVDYCTSFLLFMVFLIYLQLFLTLIITVYILNKCIFSFNMRIQNAVHVGTDTIILRYSGEICIGDQHYAVIEKRNYVSQCAK